MDAINQLSKLLQAAMDRRVRADQAPRMAISKSVPSKAPSMSAAEFKRHLISLNGQPASQREAFTKDFVSQTLRAELSQVPGIDVDRVSARVSESLLEDPRLQELLDSALKQYLHGS